MAAELRAVEVLATVDAQGHLALDEPLHGIRAGRVRLIVLTPEGVRDAAAPEDLPPPQLDTLDQEERDWLRSAALSPAFAFLHDSEEDVYSSSDGSPFQHAG